MRFKLSSGRALGYRTQGAGEVIVLLHPIGVSSAFWSSTIARLPADYRALAVDLAGHGDSDTPAGEFSLDDLADDVIELVGSLGNGPCIVVGSSMGGMIAQGVALRSPELVRGL